MLFFKKKRKVLSEELAKKLAIAFSEGIEQELLDRAKLRWMWEALPNTDPKVIAKEWAVVDMFLISMSFRQHSQDRRAVEEFLDYFHGFAWQADDRCLPHLEHNHARANKPGKLWQKA